MYFVPHGQNLQPNTQEDGTSLNEIYPVAADDTIPVQ